LSDQKIPGVLCFCGEVTVQWCNTFTEHIMLVMTVVELAI